MSFQVVMTQNKINYVLSLLIPNGWQTNSAPMEFEGLHSIFHIHKWQVNNIIWKTEIWVHFTLPALTWHALDSVCGWQLLNVQSKIYVSISAAQTLFYTANKMRLGEKPGWVIGKFLLIWLLVAALPGNPPKFNSCQGRLQEQSRVGSKPVNNHSTRRNTNWEQQQLPGGTESFPGRQQSTAEPDVPTLLQAPELQGWTCSSMQAPRALLVTVPTPCASWCVLCGGYSRDEDVLCAGGHELGPHQALEEKVAPRWSSPSPYPECHKLTPRPTRVFLCLYCIPCPTDGADFLEGSSGDPATGFWLVHVCSLTKGTGGWRWETPRAVQSQGRCWGGVPTAAANSVASHHHQWRVLARERAMSSHFHTGMADQPGRIPRLHR